MEFNIAMPNQIAMIVSALLPPILSFVVKGINSKKLRNVFCFVIFGLVGFIGAWKSGGSLVDIPFMIAGTTALGFATYKKFWKKPVDKIEGSGY